MEEVTKRAAEPSAHARGRSRSLHWEIISDVSWFLVGIDTHSWETNRRLGNQFAENSNPVLINSQSPRLRLCYIEEQFSR
jgi:hypothetical protein